MAGAGGIMIVAGGGVLAGVVLPWIEVASMFGTLSVKGSSTDDGPWVIAAGVGLALCGVVVAVLDSRALAVLGLLCAGAALIIGIVEISNYRERIAEDPGEGVAVSIGSGLWVLVGAAAVGLIASLLAVAQAD